MIATHGLIGSTPIRCSTRRARAEWSATGPENQRSARMGVRFFRPPPTLERSPNRYGNRPLRGRVSAHERSNRSLSASSGVRHIWFGAPVCKTGRDVAPVRVQIPRLPPMAL